MVDEPSPTPDLEEIFRRIEQSALKNPPNPDRSGCLTEESLTAFAANPRAFSMRDPIFEHLAHCSECFKFVHARRSAG